VRELVYLSDRKLEQFLPTLRSLWPRPKLNLKSHGVEIGVDPTPDADRKRLQHLAKVIAHIERSARWFLDPEITPGQWVHFEAPLNYLAIRSDDRDLVFFVDRSRPTATYPTGGATRLVLHCSGTHLRTEHRPVQVPAPPGVDVDVAVRLHGGSAGVFTVDSIELVLNSLRTRDPLDDDPPHSWEVRHHLPAATTRLLRAIDARLYPETAAWMAGYARITANLTAREDSAERRYVIASPLYIEYAPPPSAP
jgi:hypothetical protein